MSIKSRAYPRLVIIKVAINRTSTHPSTTDLTHYFRDCIHRNDELPSLRRSYWEYASERKTVIYII